MLVSQYEEILVINWTLVSISLFSFASWTEVVALQRKPGLRKGIRDCNPTYSVILSASALHLWN